MTTNSINNQITNNDFLVQKTGSGTSVVSTIQETSDSADATARVIVKVAGTSSGDAYTRYAIGATRQYSIGIDNSDVDKFKITTDANSVTPSSANQILVDTVDGEITLPLQPSFLATLSATQANVTGDGTAYSIICDDEVWDKNGDYSPVTGLFTAPISGKYIFGGCSYLFVGGTPTNGSTYIVTTDATYWGEGASPTLYQSAGGTLHWVVLSLCKMDAGDTAKLVVDALNSTKTCSVGGGAFYRLTYFYGCLSS